MICLKRCKGYNLINCDNLSSSEENSDNDNKIVNDIHEDSKNNGISDFYDGDYLEKKDKFLELFVYKNYVKINEGEFLKNDKKNTNLRQFSSNSEAIKFAKKIVSTNICDGYKVKKEKFFYYFNENDIIETKKKMLIEGKIIKANKNYY